jgi:serine/threonine protein kinase
MELDHVASSFDPTELSPNDTWQSVGDGGYSEVYKATLLGAPVAVKQVTSRKKSSGEALLREIRFLRMVGPHPNIVLPFGSFVDQGKVHLVMQYTKHCLRTDRVAQTCDAVRTFAGVARALVRLHGMGIVHRDLKARNVLLGTFPDRTEQAILIDFGLATCSAP